MQQELYQIADELRAIANAGLRWSENGYDRERYEQVLKVSARLVAAAENGSFDAVYQQYTDNLAHVSPVMCVEALVYREGKILLIQRSDDRTWAVPGGLLEVGESAARGAERELWEEAGLRGQAVRLLALFDSRFWPANSRMQLCIAQFVMDADGDPLLHAGISETNSPLAEALDVGFFGEDELPELHRGHDQRVPKAFELLRAGADTLYFDR